MMWRAQAATIMLYLIVIALQKVAESSIVTFYDQKDFQGDSITFHGGGGEGEGDCSACVRVKRASWWESYRSSAGSVILYDSSDCTGRNSGKMPSTTPNLWAIAFASKGGQKQELQRPGRAMQFIPTASIESFQLCQEQVPTRGP